MKKILIALCLLSVFLFSVGDHQAHANKDREPDIMSIKTTSVSK
ncbi:hypothetical protein [Sporosarcina sp. OR05]